MIIYYKLKQQKFSGSYEVMAQCVLNHPKDVLKMNIQDFATINFVSNSSVVRFCQKLGFNGYSDFKIQLALEIDTFTVDKQRVEVEMPIKPNASNKEIAHSFSGLYQQTITEVYHNLDFDKLQKVAMLIDQAPYISLWGNGPSMLVALDFYYKIKRLGYVIQCNDIIGFHQVPVKRKRLGEVAIIVSSYANSAMIRQWVTQHKRAGSKLVLLTCNSDNPFKNIVDYMVAVNTEEKRTGKLGHFASRTAMNYIMDVLYAMVFSIHYEDNIKILEEENQSINTRGEYIKTLNEL